MVSRYTSPVSRLMRTPSVETDLTVARSPSKKPLKARAWISPSVATGRASARAMRIGHRLPPMRALEWSAKSDADELRGRGLVRHQETPGGGGPAARPRGHPGRRSAHDRVREVRHRAIRFRRRYGELRADGQKDRVPDVHA